MYLLVWVTPSVCPRARLSLAFSSVNKKMNVKRVCANFRLDRFISNFNPLFLDDTPTNRNFLVEWLKVLVSYNGEIVTAEDMGTLNTAIDGIYRLPKKERRLRNLAPFLGLEIGNSLAVRIKIWNLFLRVIFSCWFKNERT